MTAWRLAAALVIAAITSAAGMGQAAAEVAAAGETAASTAAAAVPKLLDQGSVVTLGGGQSYNTDLTFSEFPVGTSITSQYQPEGIDFSGDSPFITTDSSDPTSPVLSGSPRFEGRITGTFVHRKTGKQASVNQFAISAGYFDSLKSTRLVWYDTKGKMIAKMSNQAKGIERFTINSKTPIGSFDIHIIGKEANGFAIDNVRFNAPADATGCGDARDQIIKQYVTNKVGFTPLCANFTTTAASANYTFAELDTSKFKFALIRQPLTIPSYYGYGLDAWVSYIGSVHKITKAYRTPGQLAANGASPDARYVFGDAVALQNNTKTKAEQKMLKAAAMSAGADYIAPNNSACGLRCVHVDWRAHIGPYDN